MSNSIYREYLMSEEWNVKRKAALWRAQWRCQSPLCRFGFMRAMTDAEIIEEYGKAPKLQVHHLTYERFMCEEPDDLLVLCATCHRGQHGIDEPPDDWQEPPEVGFGPEPLNDVLGRAIAKLVSR